MRSQRAPTRDLAALLLGLALAVLVAGACLAAPSLGTARTPLLAGGCAGGLAALALQLSRDAGRGRWDGPVTAAMLLLALGSCIVLILVCAVATVPGGE